ncbi:DNA internalization-related competence protein ComEC/Rec2 [Colwelliaceae bacterium 6441]
MDWWLITFFLGSLLSLFLPIVPTLFYVILFICFTIVFLCSAKTRKFSGLFIGCAWMLLHGEGYQQAKQNHFITSIEQPNKNIAILGKVTSIVQLKQGTQRFNFDITHINQHQLNSPLLVRLSWRNDKNQAFSRLAEGQQWQLLVRLKPAHGLANLAGFSYQSWLRKNNLVATGYVVKSNNHRFKNTLIKPDKTIRQLLYQKIHQLLPPHDLSPFILALTFGERGDLSKAHWQVLKNTATQHLIAISGLHLGLVAAGVFVFFSVLLKHLPLQNLLSQYYQLKIIQLNHQGFVITCTLLFTLFYAYLAGFSVPTLRALLMLLVYWGARGLAIKLSISRLFLLTLFFIVLVAPFSLFSQSFWLSFYAVGLIFALLWRFQPLFSQVNHSDNSRISKCKKWFSTLCYLQLTLFVLMLPITVQFNHQLSLVSLPANLIAVPWMSLTAIPLSLLSVIFVPISESVASFFIYAALQSLTWLWQYLAWLSEFSLANINVSFSYWLYILALSLMLLAHFFVGIALRYTMLMSLMITLLLMTYSAQQNTQGDHWQVNIMDVGQGLSVIIEVNDQQKLNKKSVLIYDTGATFPSGFSMTEAVIIPFLHQQGYQSIDKLIISHDDNDHSGGLSLLLEQFAISQLFYNDQSLAKALPCNAGEHIKWRQLSIEFLWPSNGLAGHNDDSCVVKISDGKHSVLLTGDISRKVEQQLIHHSRQKINADILVAPHHGSKTSSSKAFIEAVSPEYAIFSAGFLNRWKMPVDSVVERYEQLNVKTLNTANKGMIRLEITPENIHVLTYREDIWPYWFAN